MTGNTMVLAFLGLAFLIVLLALVLTRAFADTIRREKGHDDLNAGSHDGRGTATWIGIDKASDDEPGPQS